MSSDTDPTNPNLINTAGGAMIDGTVNTAGDFVGRDQMVRGDQISGDKILGDKVLGNKTVITEETAYTVQRLINPYLGLRAFGYADRAIYAGREQLAQETVQRLTAPGAQQTILFITGSSGSGKSSFAQAGLIPLLENHYAAYQKTVRHAVFRPSSQPLVMLADALQKLNPDRQTEFLSETQFVDHLAPISPTQINLLLIDQFEELFIQSEASQRPPFCDFLINLPDFAASHTHILITLRVDYLDELFAIQPLWAIAKEGVELRTMKADDLRNAIQKPLQINYPQKRFAPELLERLVQDGGADAALLPLLQVTLAELWKTGKLVLSNYHSLTDAIRQRADTVYDFNDYDKADPQKNRSTDEQKELIEILLDLINVSVDGDDRRDVRQHRTRYELEKSSPQRPRLIEELINARLLSASETRNGAEMEVIDIIHESLIDNWDRLQEEIEKQRQQLQRRARFKLWRNLWEQNQKVDNHLLLTDIQLAEAKMLVDVNDIELRELNSPEFYWLSLEYQAKIQRVKEKEAAEHRARQQWLQRVGLALILAIIAAGIALWQWQRAQVAADGQMQARATSDANATLANMQRQDTQIAATGEAQARATAMIAKQFVEADLWEKEALTLQKSQPSLAILLALEAWFIQKDRGEPHVSTATENLVQLLVDIHGIPLFGHTGAVNDLEFSPDGKWLASASEDATVRLWDLLNLDEQQAILLRHSSSVQHVAFSPDQQWFATAAQDGSINAWPTNALQSKPHTLLSQSNSVTDIAFSQDGRYLFAMSNVRSIYAWDLLQLSSDPQMFDDYQSVCQMFSFAENSSDLATLCQLSKLLNQQWRDNILDLENFLFNPDAQWIADINYNSGNLLLWSTDIESEEPEEIAFEERISTLAQNDDYTQFAIGSEDSRVYIVENLNAMIQTPNDFYFKTLYGHSAAITTLKFAPNGEWLASGNADGDIRLWSGDNSEYEWQEDYSPIVESVPIYIPDGCKLSCPVIDIDCIECRKTQRLALLSQNANVSQLTNLACLCAGRNLTSAEWNQYFGEATYRTTCPQLPSHQEMPNAKVTATP